MAEKEKKLKKMLDAYDFRVIAEGEIRLIREKVDQPTFAFARIGNYEWNCSINKHDETEKDRCFYPHGRDSTCDYVLINFKRIIEDAGKENEQIEADFYEWSTEKGFQHVKNMISTSIKENKFFFNDSDNDGKPYGGEAMVKVGRHLQYKCSYMKTSALKFLIVIQIKKRRSTFPNFTTAEKHIRPITGVLNIGNQQFHVNKEYLAAISPFFTSFFNGKFAEGGEELVRLQGMSPIYFHEFLLVVDTYPREERVLPRVSIVKELLEFSQYFEIGFLKQLCVDHLLLHRRYGEGNRVAIAHKYGLFRVVDLILADVGNDDVRLVSQMIMQNQ